MSAPTVTTRDHRDYTTGYATISATIEVPEFDTRDASCLAPFAITARAEQWSGGFAFRLVFGPYHERDARGDLYWSVTLGPSPISVTQLAKIRVAVKREAREGYRAWKRGEYPRAGITRGAQSESAS